MESEFKKKYKKLLDEAISDLKTKGKRYKQIPNILTTIRMASPLVIIPAAATGNAILTAILALGFGLTDFVDGYIARKYKLQSELGAKLDALTDKIFVGTLLIASSIANPILLFNLLLELVISSINIKEEMKSNNPKSSLIGKVKTWFLFALAGAGIISQKAHLASLITPLAIGAGAMQLLTIKSYLKKYKNSDSENKTLKIDENEEERDFTDKLVEDKTHTKSKEKKNTERKDEQKNKEKKTKETEIEELKKVRAMLTPNQEEKENNKVLKKIK